MTACYKSDKIMDKQLISKLEKEIKFQQEQFNFLYGEHFKGDRYEDKIYDKMIEDVNKSKGKIEVLLELLGK